MQLGDMNLSEHYLHVSVAVLYLIYLLQIPPIFLLVCLTWFVYNRHKFSNLFTWNGLPHMMPTVSTIVQDMTKINFKHVVQSASKERRTPLLTSKARVLTIANTYAEMDERARLPSTPMDIRHMQKLFRTSKQKKYLDLSAAAMDTKIAKFVKHLNAFGTPGCLFFSMHGVGGAFVDEALVGDDGQLLKEDRLAKIIEKNCNNIPLLVLIVDACNSGGILNLPHAYTVRSDNTMESITHRDGLLGTHKSFNPRVPCICLSAARESQVTEAYSTGSLFTIELVKASKPGKSVWDVLCSVSLACRQRKSPNRIDPVVAFNDAFLTLHSKHGKSHRDVLNGVCIVNRKA